MEVLDANSDRANSSTLPYSADGDLLRVSDLSVNVPLGADRQSRIVWGISFAIGRREIVGLLGESGSGKTTTALAVMQLLSPSTQAVTGSVEFMGRDLCGLNAGRLREIRGSEISIVYQDSDALNPFIRAGDQIMEVLRAHRSATSAQMRAEVYSVLSAMRLPDCERIFRSYPHQLSGGQRRRIAIAQALVCKPRLIIADEPTASLDSRTADEILSLFKQARDLYDTSLLLISHDPGALSIADRILVMYAGEIVEEGTTDEILAQPKHPYTAALLRCRDFTSSAARLDGRRRRLPCIPGHAPDPSHRLPGCTFSARCPDRMDSCDSHSPKLVEISATRSVRCFKYEDGIKRA